LLAVKSEKLKVSSIVIEPYLAAGLGGGKQRELPPSANFAAAKARETGASRSGNTGNKRHHCRGGLPLQHHGRNVAAKIAE
jgi:hypothetical protein